MTIFSILLTSLRFQKRLQLNLLQLVDAASNQFKTTQKNPVAAEAEAQEATLMQHDDAPADGNGSGNAVGGEEAFAKRTRKKRASFTDMPKI